MTLKRRVWLWYIGFFTFLLKRKGLRDTVHDRCSAEETLPDGHIDIFTVAFNNEKYIAWQIRQIRRFVRDDRFSFIVADNSSVPHKRTVIRELCARNGVGYVSVPKSILFRFPGGSYAHGTVLNWLFSAVVRARRPRFFGFLDHDLFPVAPVSIRDKIAGKDFYGYVKSTAEGWYLWAGLCFFDFNKVKGLPLDFVPYMANGTYLDTGGSNFPLLYRKYDLHSLKLPGSEIVKVTGGGDCYHADFVQRIDGCWLHAINGSNWKGVSLENMADKERIVDGMLRKSLEVQAFPD